MLHSKPANVLERAAAQCDGVKARKKRRKIKEDPTEVNDSNHSMLKEAIKQRKKGSGKSLILDNQKELQRRSLMLKEEHSRVEQGLKT